MKPDPYSSNDTVSPRLLSFSLSTRPFAPVPQHGAHSKCEHVYTYMAVEVGVKLSTPPFSPLPSTVHTAYCEHVYTYTAVEVGVKLSFHAGN